MMTTMLLLLVMMMMLAEIKTPTITTCLQTDDIPYDFPQY